MASHDRTELAALVEALQASLVEERAKSARFEQALTEALERQAATSEILRVISTSPADVQPVFEAIADSAMRLFGAWSAGVFRCEDGIILPAAARGGLPGSAEAFMDQQLLVPSASTVDAPHARVVLNRTVQHVVDVSADPSCGPWFREHARQRGFRSVVAVPMLRGEDVVGVVAVTRVPAGGFGPAEIALIQTFGDQARIALENARLLGELHARNADLTEALEQQTATAEILRVISRSTFDLQPVLETLVENAPRLAGAEGALVARFDGEVFRFLAERGAPPAYSEFWRRNVIRPGRGSAAGRAALERRTVHILDALEDPEWDQVEAQRVGGYRTVLAVPMLKQDELVGVLFMWRTEVRAFTDKQIDLVGIFADQASIAIENARLFSELQARNADLTEALDRQTATAEILRVVSQAQADVQPVFDTIARSAARLCEATDAVIYQQEGDRLWVVAVHGTSPLGRRELTVSRLSVVGRAAHDRRAVHVEDLAEAVDVEFPDSQRMKALGYRTILAIPLVREGASIGAIMIRRTEVRPFSDGQVALLETFADQAVIAIGNVRLLNELQAKNATLTEALERQTATGEILRVISRSPTDVQPVFEVIVESACRLCDGVFANALRFDGELLHNMADHGFTPEARRAMVKAFPRKPGRDSMSGRAILARDVVQSEDVTTDAEAALARERPEVLGFHAQIGVPLLRDGVPIGAIVVARREPGRFPDRQVDLLTTFAAQAVIAVENVRLFTELEARNGELRAALEQQTATAEILRVIAGSPTEIQPTFETIATSATGCARRMPPASSAFDGELIHFVAHHGRTSTADRVGPGVDSPRRRRATARRPGPS